MPDFAEIPGDARNYNCAAVLHGMTAAERARVVAPRARTLIELAVVAGMAAAECPEDQIFPVLASAMADAYALGIADGATLPIQSLN